MPIDHARIARHPVVKWSIVGGVFAVLGLGLIALFFKVFHWPYWLSTALQAEIVTLLRFPINDRWVFGHAHPTWRRLGQYHIANAGSLAVWWVAANFFQRIGVHYLLSPALAAGCSVGVGLISNFLWIWRKKPTPAVAE